MMTKRTWFWTALVAAAAVVAIPSLPAASAADPIIYGCVVKLEDNQDNEVPALEAGLLVELAVHEGSLVKKGDVIGRIYDKEIQMQKKAAEYALAGARKRAEDDVQIRYAEKSAEVAQKNYEKMLESNQISGRSVPQIEIDKAKLEWDAAVLSAEKAAHEQALALFEYWTKRAERDLAQLALERRTIRAPFDGEVVTIFRHQNDWVSPGDPILRLVNLETMVVEGMVELAAFDPHEVQQQKVTVEIEMARGRVEQVSGRITYVSPLLLGDRKFVIRAEVGNRQEYGRWLLQDNYTNAKMTIHLDATRAAALER